MISWWRRTYPSGWSFTKKRFRLNEIFRIFAQENVLIRVMPWNTAIPIWATAKLSGTPSMSLAPCILMPYNSQRRAVSSKFKSASAGVCPLHKMNYIQSVEWILIIHWISSTYTCFLWFSIIFRCIVASWCGTKRYDDKYVWSG